MHFWSKFGDSSLNGWQVMVRTSSNDVKFDFQVKFHLEGQGRSPNKTIETLTKVFCICAPNLVILAWTGGELSRGQTRDWHTDRHTQTQATTIPEGQNWPRVKIIEITKMFLHLLSLSREVIQASLHILVVVVDLIHVEGTFLAKALQCGFHTYHLLLTTLAVHTLTSDVLHKQELIDFYWTNLHKPELLVKFNPMLGFYRHQPNHTI